MIPICLKPKRFPAALGNTRKINNQMNIVRNITSSSFQLQIRSAAAVNVPFVRFNSTFNQNNINFPVVSGSQFYSTVQLEHQIDSATESRNATHEVKKVHRSSAGVANPLQGVIKKPVPLPTNVVTPTPAEHAQAATLQLLPNLKLHGDRDDAWWTGKNPLGKVGERCPGVEADGRIYSLPQLTFAAATAAELTSPAAVAAEGALLRNALQNYFDNTWALTEVLLSALQGEEAFMRPPYHDLRHPMIFYYGHPAALYINKLRVAGLLDKPINAYFEVIFETGVDEMSWDDLSKNQMAWPSVKEVHAYRQQVYATVSNLIASLTDEQLVEQGISQQSPLWALVMAFEHERIHLETSSFLLSEMPQEFVKFPKGFPAYHPTARLSAAGAASSTASAAAATIATASTPAATKSPVAGVHYPVNHFIAVPESQVTIGKPRDFPSFGWDNEYGQRTYTVPAFKASEYKVTNGEFLEFMKDGGYSDSALWSAAGWEWRTYRNVKAPTHFVRTGPQGSHEYALRLVFDTTAEVPWDWPVVVNFHEAAAYARWKGSKSGKVTRVLTELEHRAIRDVSNNNTTNAATDAAAAVAQDHAAVLGGNKMMQQVMFFV